MDSSSSSSTPSTLTTTILPDVVEELSTTKTSTPRESTESSTSTERAATSMSSESTDSTLSTTSDESSTLSERPSPSTLSTTSTFTSEPTTTDSNFSKQTIASETSPQFTSSRTLSSTTAQQASEATSEESTAVTASDATPSTHSTQSSSEDGSTWTESSETDSSERTTGPSLKSSTTTAKATAADSSPTTLNATTSSSETISSTSGASESATSRNATVSDRSSTTLNSTTLSSFEPTTESAVFSQHTASTEFSSSSLPSSETVSEPFSMDGIVSWQYCQFERQYHTVKWIIKNREHGNDRIGGHSNIGTNEHFRKFYDEFTVIKQFVEDHYTRIDSFVNANYRESDYTTPAPSSTTINWPTGGTTRILPSGEIIISESLIAYNNCTTVLYQLLYNPATNTTRTAVTTDPNGCETTTSLTNSSSTTLEPSSTTVFNWPTGGTTKILPSGDIIISEALIAYENCTTVLLQLIYSPVTNTSRTDVTSDAQGCKASSSVTSAIIDTTTPIPFSFPESKTTQILPSGEIILSESLTAYQNCTTVLRQLIYSPISNTTRIATTSDPEGCKAATATTTSKKASVECSFPPIDLSHAKRPTAAEQKDAYSVGEKLFHLCERPYVMEWAKQPLRVYTCKPNGQWSGVFQKCINQRPGTTELR
ncbi:unnamed protein product [Caenorhabditis sp. 36 PRJEB53466]|nr:unnamed protein product [Caenorhabditis sp. 36 PRJEB53466]